MQKSDGRVESDAFERRAAVVGQQRIGNDSKAFTGSGGGRRRRSENVKSGSRSNFGKAPK